MTANHTAYWWESNGLKFRSQRELEKVIEQFADAGTLDHVKAAKTLMHEAITQNKMTAAQFTSIKERLHL